MTDIREIWKVCEQENITVDSVSCPRCGSFSVMVDGLCFIALDCALPERQVKEHAAHEVGHCVKGAFYNISSPLDVVSQHEYRADKWAIEKLVPRDQLIGQIRKNNDSLYLLAEHFGVTEDFIRKACLHYGLYNEPF